MIRVSLHFLSSSPTGWSIGTRSAHGKEQHDWDDVHPVLREEGSIVFGFTSLLGQFLLLHLLDEGRSIRLRSGFHVLDIHSGAENVHAAR